MLIVACARLASSPRGDRRGERGRPAGLVWRLVQLLAGLVAFGVSLALMVRAQLGLGPWDVLHQGIAERSGLDIGWVVIGVSALVLAVWIPLRQRPGLGTLANAIVVGLSVNAALAVLPAPRQLAPRIVLLVVGIVANGAATGMYVGAGLGPGPRDGLMMGLAQRGYAIRTARTLIELGALALGWALGGSVGVGTVAYGLSIGPLAHYFIPRLTIPPDDRRNHRVRVPGRGSAPREGSASKPFTATQADDARAAPSTSRQDGLEQCCSA